MVQGEPSILYFGQLIDDTSMAAYLAENVLIQSGINTHDQQSRHPAHVGL